MVLHYIIKIQHDRSTLSWKDNSQTARITFVIQKTITEKIYLIKKSNSNLKTPRNILLGKSCI